MSSVPGGEPHPWFEPVSWKPRSFVAHQFVTPEETAHIIRVAQPQVRGQRPAFRQVGYRRRRRRCTYYLVPS